MDIIFSRKVAEELADRYTVLELETHDVEGQILETFCVIPGDKISMDEIAMLEHWKKLHNEFVQANRNKNGKLCWDLAEHLRGKWGGELDEFYDIVCARFPEPQNS